MYLAADPGRGVVAILPGKRWSNLPLMHGVLSPLTAPPAQAVTETVAKPGALNSPLSSSQAAPAPSISQASGRAAAAESKPTPAAAVPANAPAEHAARQTASARSSQPGDSRLAAAQALQELPGASALRAEPVRDSRQPTARVEASPVPAPRPAVVAVPFAGPRVTDSSRPLILFGSVAGSVALLGIGFLFLGKNEPQPNDPIVPARTASFSPAESPDGSPDSETATPLETVAIAELPERTLNADDGLEVQAREGPRPPAAVVEPAHVPAAEVADGAPPPPAIAEVPEDPAAQPAAVVAAVIPVEQRLRQPIKRFDQLKPASVRELLFSLEEMIGVPIRIENEVGDENVALLERSVTLRLQSTTLEGLLQAVVEKASLAWSIDAQTIRIHLPARTANGGASVPEMTP